MLVGTWQSIFRTKPNMDCVKRPLLTGATSAALCAPLLAMTVVHSLFPNKGQPILSRY